MLQPSFEEVRRRSREGDSIPVFVEVLADTITPVSAYISLNCGSGSFLLESIEGGERLGRYSFIGLQPVETITLSEGEAVISGGGREERLPYSNPLDMIDRMVRRKRMVQVPGLPRFHGGAVGFLSYDLVRSFERIPAAQGMGLALPLGILGIYRTVLAFDHLRRTLKIITHVATSGDLESSYRAAEAELLRIAESLRGAADARQQADPRPPMLDGDRGQDSRVALDFETNVTPARFRASVLRAKDYISAGDVIQVVLSQRLSVRSKVSALALYRSLRSVNPSPYMYLLNYGEFQLVGSSPEMLVRVEGGTVAVHPIAGTRRRGSDLQEDEQLARELVADEKELAEHHMLLDLGRNDVGRVSEPGTVAVKQRAEVERYSHVMHLVSHVEGQLRKDLRPVDAVMAGFPAGTVSGAPKVRAMEIIAELEPDSRGPYAGCVGYFGFDGSIDTAITIRTAVVKAGVVHLQVGAGIVADSDPEREYEETMTKAGAMIKAIQAAEAMEEPAGEHAGSYNGREEASPARRAK